MKKNNLALTFVVLTAVLLLSFGFVSADKLGTKTQNLEASNSQGSSQGVPAEGTCVGDTNLDFKVDSEDINNILTHWDDDWQNPDEDETGDVNFDGYTGFADILLVLANWGDCDFQSHRVFVTSQIYRGNLGNYWGADEKCQNAADNVNLGGTWKAWVSSPSPGGDVSERLHHSVIPYTLLDGTIIADNWDDLTNCEAEPPYKCLKHEIDQTETKVVPGGITRIWTGTNRDGTPTASHCNIWGTMLSGVVGTIGSTEEINSGWSNNGFGTCDSFGRLYCFEQPVSASPGAGFGS